MGTFPKLLFAINREERIKIHFLEALERETSFQHEFEKIENMLVKEVIGSSYSLEWWVADNFRDWKQRGSYASFEEVRKQLGFQYQHAGTGITVFARGNDINKYFLYCEMLINIFNGLKANRTPNVTKKMVHIVETMMAVIEKAGFELRNADGESIIVEKNAAAIEVADKVPELADVIIEYNHYLLRGNIDRKKHLLKQIADALEPKRKTLEGICKEQTKNFFELVNNMNIRHNNLDPADKGKYNPVFASYTPVEQEEWYDLIYEQALMLFILLEQQDRNKKIDTYKQAKASLKA